MKRNKTLLLVDNIELVDKLEEKDDITFLFPIKDFTVGMPNTFKVEELPMGSFIFLNRVLDNKDIDNLRKLLENLPNDIKGIVFDDIGVLNVLLDLKLPITTILFLNHLNCNYESINAYLEYVDSVVVSPDINLEEIDEILAKALKPVVLYTFGFISIMYSRRTLLTNYNEEFNKNIPLNSSLEEEISKQKFKVVESVNGTVIYPNKPFNALNLRDKDNVLYNLINTLFLKPEEVEEILNSDNNLETKYPYKYLSDKKMIVKLKEELP
ncbi:MAG: U32 family peptidase [Ruminococcus sp.]|nr:U32 family peptidase [Ruminococcus sp.]